MPFHWDIWVNTHWKREVGKEEREWIPNWLPGRVRRLPAPTYVADAGTFLYTHVIIIASYNRMWDARVFLRMLQENNTLQLFISHNNAREYETKI